MLYIYRHVLWKYITKWCQCVYVSEQCVRKEKYSCKHGPTNVQQNKNGTLGKGGLVGKTQQHWVLQKKGFYWIKIIIKRYTGILVSSIKSE